MIRGQYFLLIIIFLTIIIIVIAQKNIYQSVIDVEINGKTAPYSLKSIRIEDGEIYIATSYLEKHGGLKTEIINGKEIAVYRGDAFVTFMLGKETRDAFKKSGRHFIPLKRLVEGLGGKYIWDKENKIIVIDFY